MFNSDRVSRHGNTFHRRHPGLVRQDHAGLLRPPGFRFSKLDPTNVDVCDTASPPVHDLLVQARRVLKEAEGLITALRQLCDQLEAKKPT